MAKFFKVLTDFFRPCEYSNNFDENERERKSSERAYARCVDGSLDYAKSFTFYRMQPADWRKSRKLRETLYLSY